MADNDNALLRLLSLSFEGAGSYRQAVDALPLSGQGRVLVCGAEGCVDGDTYIHYDVRDSEGLVRNKKGASIKRLYHRFHQVEPRKGVGQYLRGLDEAQFWVSSVNDEGRIFKNRILDVVKTGTKPCLRIESDGGQVIVATADHKFWVGDRYLPAGELEVGSTVYIHNNTPFTNPNRKRGSRPAVCVKHHPNGHPKDVVDRKAGKTYRYVRVPRSHLSVEAHINGLSFSAYRRRLNEGDLEGLEFLPPNVHVHHRDENFLNDDPSNLDVIAPREHNRQHALEQHNNLRFVAVEATVTAITPVGERETYDLKVQGPFNNFVANGFVVHNSGKSMVPEVMTLILYGKGSPRMRTTGLVESTIVNEVTGYRGTLEFESGHGAAARHVEITQAFKHKRLKSRYIITVDGQREEPEGKPEQKKMVKRLAPLSMGEWLGVVYLSQGAVHDLLAGTPTAKREYLTSVFGLDFYDDLVNVAKDELKSFKSLAAGIDSLEQRRKDLAEDLKEQEAILAEVPGGIGEVEEGIAKLSKRLQTQAAKLGKLEGLAETAETYREVLEEIAASERWTSYVIENKEAASKALKQARREQSEMIQSLAEDRAVLKGIQRHQATRDKAEKAVAKAKVEVKRLKDKKSQLVKDTKGIPKSEVLAALYNLASRGEQLLGAEVVLDPSLEDGDVPSTGWEEAVKEASGHRQAANQLRKVAKATGSVCPTCQQAVDLGAMKASIATLEQQAEVAFSRAVSGLTDDLLAITDWWNTSKISIGELAARAEESMDLWEDLEQATTALQEAQGTLDEAEAALTETPQPEDPHSLQEAIEAREDELTEIDSRVDGLNNLVRLYERAETLASQARDLNLDEIEAEIEGLRNKQTQTQARYDKAMAIKTRHDQAGATIRGLLKQQDEVDEKIQEHAENALKIKHYELTIIPYFNSLRAAKVHSCVNVLEGVLPVYVAAMAENQYRGSEIKLNISDDLKSVELMLKAGRYSEWVSALQSSGGQRRGFTLAIIAALREVSPRRANIMFFDEPFADLESERKLLFVNRLMPLLRDRCEDLESIFLIAHDREILEASNDSFDTVWVAERDATGSRLLLDQKLAQVEGR